MGLYLGKTSCGCGPQGLILLHLPQRAASRGRSPAGPSKEKREGALHSAPSTGLPQPPPAPRPCPDPFWLGSWEKAGLGWPTRSTSLGMSPGPHQTALAPGWAGTPVLLHPLLAETKLDLVQGLCRLRWGHWAEICPQLPGEEVSAEGGEPRTCLAKGEQRRTGPRKTEPIFVEHKCLKYLLSGKHMLQTNTVELNISYFIPLL